MGLKDNRKNVLRMNYETGHYAFVIVEINKPSVVGLTRTMWFNFWIKIYCFVL